MGKRPREAGAQARARGTGKRAREAGGGGGAYAAALRRVPRGEVVTFGELALMAAGHTGMGALIQAGRSVRQVPTASRESPWWRAVATGRGPLAELLQAERAAEQRRRLAAEGVDLDGRLRRPARGPPAFLRPALGAALLEPAAAHTRTLVYLHGRGYTGTYYALHPEFFRPRGGAAAAAAAGLRVVLPTAPLSAGAGKPLTEWYSGWPPGEADLAGPRAALTAVVDDEVRRLGGRADRVFLGGSSQGCILGLDFYVRRQTALGGFCGVVGFWPSLSDGALRGAARGARRARPIRLLNGVEDRVVEWSMARPSYEKFRRAGFSNLRVVAEERLGHQLGPREGRWICQFLEEALPT